MEISSWSSRSKDQSWKAAIRSTTSTGCSLRLASTGTRDMDNPLLARAAPDPIGRARRESASSDLKPHPPDRARCGGETRGFGRIRKESRGGVHSLGAGRSIAAMWDGRLRHSGLEQACTACVHFGRERMSALPSHSSAPRQEPATAAPGRCGFFVGCAGAPTGTGLKLRRCQSRIGVLADDAGHAR